MSKAIKPVNQMNMAELLVIKAVYETRTDHVAQLMMVRILEAIKAAKSFTQF